MLAVLLAACVLGAAGYFIARQRAARTGAGDDAQIAAPPAAEARQATAEAASAWKIEGAITEACTCSVPCSCNFGEGPSPHSYCYPFYSYHVRKGSYGDVSLDGLHFGSADLKSGRYMFMDERATERQREALRLIMARVVERVPAEKAEEKAKEIAGEIRYVAVEQTYDDRKNFLRVAGFGEFAADYIMGMDKRSPVVVRNNTTWRVLDAIKAKTSIYKVRVGRDSVNTKETNSNQGDFEYSADMNFGGPARWNCGACANHAANEEPAGSCHRQ